MRRSKVPGSTSDQRLLDSRGSADWVHTDPWRVMRIQSEFVTGFGALAELGPAVSVFGSARTQPARPGLRARHAGRSRPSSRPATPSSPAEDRGRWRPPTAAPSRPGGTSVGLGHRAALRGGPQRVRRPRRQLPLLLRAQDDVRQVRPGLRRPAGRLRHPRRAVRGGDPGADPEGHELPDRPPRLVDYWGGLLDWLRDTAAAAGTISAVDLDLLTVTDDVDEAVAAIVAADTPRRRARGHGSPGAAPRPHAVREHAPGVARSAAVGSGPWSRSSSSPSSPSRSSWRCSAWRAAGSPSTRSPTPSTPPPTRAFPSEPTAADVDAVRFDTATARLPRSTRSTPTSRSCATSSPSGSGCWPTCAGAVRTTRRRAPDRSEGG